MLHSSPDCIGESFSQERSGGQDGTGEAGAAVGAAPLHQSRLHHWLMHIQRRQMAPGTFIVYTVYIIH